MRLVDADKLLEQMRSRLDMQDTYLPIHFKEWVIDETPTVEAEPTRHGHWIDHTYKYRYPIGRYECSICGAAHDMEWDYCPNCGAKMDEEENT